MNPPVLNTVYCCIAEGNKVMYSYNSKGQELEALAAECLENAPAFHTWYFHTVGTMTFGFLMVDGYTYFAIIDPGLGHLALLQFLQDIRNAFKEPPNSSLQDELVLVIKHLVASLEYMRQPSLLINGNSDGSNSTKESLLGKNDGRHHDRKDKVSEDDGVVGHHNNGVVSVEVPLEPMQILPLQRSIGLTRIRAQKLCWRQSADPVEKGNEDDLGGPEFWI